MFNKLLDSNAQGTFVIVDLEVLKEAFTLWAAENLATQREREESDTLVSAKDVSKRLGKDMSTLHRWNKNGYLKFVKVGGINYYHERDVREIEKGGLV